MRCIVIDSKSKQNFLICSWIVEEYNGTIHDLWHAKIWHAKNDLMTELIISSGRDSDKLKSISRINDRVLTATL